MIVIKNFKDVLSQIKIYKNHGFKIGFVPTMGALHEGHLSLVNTSSEQNHITVVSIFVNPTQFNNAEDLQKYPRTLLTDMEQLQTTKCSLLFAPESKDIYPEGEVRKKIIDLGELDEVQEGIHRPGHFTGVVQVVDVLLNIIQPDNLYLGAKDYQQCMVIRKLLIELHKQVRLVICPTMRTETGLAMSSRNARLSQEGIAIAAGIYKVLNDAKLGFKNCDTLEEVSAIENMSIQMLNTFSKVEYFHFSNAYTLMPLKSLEEDVVITVVTWIEGVRLLDNITIIRE
jgi:pantoate--beta-alanine ligase